MRIILASTNQHKIQEIRLLLADSPIQILSLHDYPNIPEPPETKETFHGNAEQKAIFVHKYTKGIVVADDSGLEVESLQGAPGVHSKRYTPEQTAEANNAKLLKELQGKRNRKAQFTCVLAIYDGHKTHYIEGVCSGSIAEQASGSAGFGYDPVFLPTDFPGRSMADLSAQEKNAISHRGHAFRQLPSVLASY